MKIREFTVSVPIQHRLASGHDVDGGVNLYDAILAKAAELEKDSFIGSGTFIGSGSYDIDVALPEGPAETFHDFLVERGLSFVEDKSLESPTIPKGTHDEA